MSGLYQEGCLVCKQSFSYFRDPAEPEAAWEKRTGKQHVMTGMCLMVEPDP